MTFYSENEVAKIEQAMVDQKSYKQIAKIIGRTEDQIKSKLGNDRKYLHSSKQDDTYSLSGGPPR